MANRAYCGLSDIVELVLFSLVPKARPRQPDMDVRLGIAFSTDVKDAGPHTFKVFWHLGKYTSESMSVSTIRLLATSEFTESKCAMAEITTMTEPSAHLLGGASVVLAEVRERTSISAKVDPGSRGEVAESRRLLSIPAKVGPGRRDEVAEMSKQAHISATPPPLQETIVAGTSP